MTSTTRVTIGFVAVATLASAGLLAAGQPRQPTPAGQSMLHPMFQDHAILQRDRPIEVYGQAMSGAAVTVTLGSGSVQARAATDGRWRTRLPRMPAGGPFVLTASANGETQTVNDVLIGDVYFCSGQSNMAFSQRQAEGASDDARTATDGQIRQLTIPPTASLTARTTFATPVRWVVGSPETVGGFSAACYYFARELKKTVNVPVGLVVAAYGGARLRTFMSEGALRKVGLENGDLDILDAYRTDQHEGLRRWGAKWETWWSSARAADGKPWLPEYDDASWKTAPPTLGAWALWNGANPDGFIGQMWMRTTLTLTAEQAATPNAVLDLGSVNQEDETWVNGRYAGASSFTNRTRYPIESGVLKPGVNVITTNVYCGWRDCGIRGPAANRAIRFADTTSVPLANPWKYREVPDGLIGPQLPWGSVHGITLDHNGMILPVGAYTFRGVVWYQGESDVHFGTPYYKTTLSALMAEWREQFNDPGLPFLIVQLPGYGTVPVQPAAATWADLREAQRQAGVADPHAAIAVTIDIGNPADLHPTNKREVGRRLAIAARHLVYGEPVAPSGPAVASVRRRGADVIVSFREVSGPLSMRAVAVSGFELCGPTQGSCRWAEARVAGDSVMLRYEGAATRVRYAWGGSPVSPLYDDTGLPAGPFEMAIR